MRLSKSCAPKRKRFAWASRFARAAVAAVILCALSSLHIAPAVYADVANSTIQVTVYRPTPSIGTVAVTYYKFGGQRYAKVEVPIRSSNNLEYTFDASAPQSRAVSFSNNWQKPSRSRFRCPTTPSTTLNSSLLTRRRSAAPKLPSSSNLPKRRLLRRRHRQRLNRPRQTRRATRRTRQTSSPPSRVPAIALRL